MAVLLRSLVVVVFVILFGEPGGAFAAAPDVDKNATGQRPSGKAATQKQELDRLFAALKVVNDESIADRIVNRIWMTWHRSGNRKVDDLISLAVIYTDEKEFDAALEVLNKVVVLLPNYAEGWNRRATLYYFMGEYDRSLVDIKKTLELEPRHFGALAGRGLIYNARGQYKKALAAFEQALRFNPFLKEKDSLVPLLRQKLGIQKI